MLQGVVVKESTDIGSWLSDADHVRASIAEAGLVLITAKNTSHLSTFVDFLRMVGAANHPALILDDEADQASLDTSVAARARARAKGKAPAASAVPSAIFSKTNVNERDGEEGFSIRQTLRHHLYLQVTATPYALLLQNTDNPLRPLFTEVLEPGQGYTGGEFFFPKTVIDEGAAPLAYVGADEGDRLAGGETPDGLRNSLYYFLVAAAAQGLADGTSKLGPQSYLCHTSVKKDDHEEAAKRVRELLNQVFESLKGDRTIARLGLQRGLKELARTVSSSLPSLEAIEEYVRQRLRNREVKVVNSEQDEANFGPKLNFIVGGNILGRGLTIDNLLVTYYLRSAKIAQMDTMLQHARMFGYRESAKPFLRVYIPELQALRFHQICRAEHRLRELLGANGSPDRVPVQVARKLRATRTSVLDTSHVEAYMPGEHLYPAAPHYQSKSAAAEHKKALERVEKLFPGGKFGPIKRDSLHPVSLTAIIEALDYIPYDNLGTGQWDPEAIKSVLQSASDLFKNQGYLYARTATRTKLTEGMVGGPELQQLRAAGRPVLCIFKDDSGKLVRIGQTVEVKIDFTYIFPEFVLPEREDLPTHVFNDTSQDAGPVE
ncbi:Z1 domain-containing protein [Corallococcus terminator]|uniref:Putative endonuclease Z1 domain-containing protein n=1 Tax=Corallococcus terminator TaxID=2316733 RepID=A0A3A8HKH7_9BACT|nr:Z1 domain-containing protein [Corallococcus terminator]RKG68034.1 hypothetical protein D7V88_40850 [Corallococcus terminator]